MTPSAFQSTIAGFTDPVIEVGAAAGWGHASIAEATRSAARRARVGFSAVTITAQDGINVRKGSIGLAVIDPPVVTAPIAPSGAAGSGQDIDLSTVFDDPDTETTAVIKTNLGDVPLTLFDSAAPITSDNFKGYMDRGDWDNTIIHRSISNFIIQGGWLHPEGDKDFSLVPSAGFIDDEYDDSRPNTGSTFAMAKNDPNTSTTNWFVSLKDNAQNLDFQAGGFAAFARVIGDGMEVFGSDRGNCRPATYRTSRLDGDAIFPQGFAADRGHRREPARLRAGRGEQHRADRSAGLRAGQGTPIRTRSSPASTAASSASVSAPASPMPGGESMITLAATDLDGARSEYSFAATSTIDYSTWAGLFQGGDALDHSDGGLLNDLQEYAFGGDPTDAADDSEIAPSLGEVEMEGERFARSYSTCGSIPPISSTLCRRAPMSPIGRQLWTSADGIDAELVADVEDAGEFWILTVRYPDSGGPAGGRLFFRTVVELELDAQ